MSIISRSSTYIKSEKGGDWFDEFLRTYANSGNNFSPVSDIVSAISSKQAETVDSVVRKYREQVGLDIIANDSNDNIKIASNNNISLSIRQANLNNNKNNVLVIIKNDPSIVKAIDSLCQHSGGNKNTHAIISYLRDKLGTDLINYTDKDLINYINDIKSKYKLDNSKEDNAIDIGSLGVDVSEQFEDNVADYITHGKPGR